MLPEDDDFARLWRQLAEFRRAGKWDAVVEGLARQPELLRADAGNAVVSSGEGLAIGVRRLFARLAAQLPEEAAQRYRDRVHPAVAELWQSDDEHSVDTLRLRHRIARDFPGSGSRREALRMEIDTAAEGGRWTLAAELCGQLLAEVSALDPNAPQVASDVARASLIAAHAAAFRRDIEALNAALARVKAVASGDSAGRLDKDLLDMITAATSALPKIAATPLPAPTVFSSLRPRAVSRRQKAAFELGRTIWQQDGSGASLRDSLNELAREAAHRDVPVPFYSAGDDRLLVFADANTLTAFDRAAAAQRWSAKLPSDVSALSGVSTASSRPARRRDFRRRAAVLLRPRARRG